MSDTLSRLTVRQGAVLSAFTGVLCGRWQDTHRYAEELFGRPVYSHEFASEAFADELREKARADFLAIMPEVVQ